MNTAPISHRNASGHFLFDVYYDVDVVKPSGAATLVRGVGPYYTYAINDGQAVERTRKMLPTYMVPKKSPCLFNPDPDSAAAYNAAERRDIQRQRLRALFAEQRTPSFA